MNTQSNIGIKKEVVAKNAAAGSWKQKAKQFGKLKNKLSLDIIPKGKIDSNFQIGDKIVPSNGFVNKFGSSFKKVMKASNKLKKKNQKSNCICQTSENDYN